MDFRYSVALNSYNREHEIGETLEAVLAQTVPPREIVVVDDGSTDDTVAEIRRFGDRVNCTRIDNVGPGQSRHAAVIRCRSPWVATCDSDDLWEPYHAEMMQRTLEAFPDTVLTFSNTTRFGPNENGEYDHFQSITQDWWSSAIEERKGDCWTFGPDAYRALLAINPVYPSCSLFDANIYRKIGGAHPPLSRITSEDSDLTRRFALEGRLSCNAVISVRMRKHGDNFSESWSSNVFGKYQILDRHVRELELSPALVTAATKERDRALEHAFQHACWEHNLERATDAYHLMRADQKTPRYALQFARLKLRKKIASRR